MGCICYNERKNIMAFVSVAGKGGEQMDSTKKYEYIMESAEIREFCLKALAEQFRCRKRKWLLLALILVLEAFTIPQAAAAVALMLLLIFVLTGIRTYTVIQKTLDGQWWTVWIEDGRVKVNRGDSSEVPCRNIQLIRTTRRLLMLGYFQAPQRPVWFVIPQRVFADEREREVFLESLRRAQAQPSDGTAYPAGYVEGAWGGEESGIAQERLRLAYMLDEEKWVRFQKGAIDLVNSGTFGNTQRLWTILSWGCLMAVFMTVCVYFAAGDLNIMWVGFSLFITMMTILRLWFRNPVKGLRRQLKSSAMRERVCGLWEISLSDAGISVDMPYNIRNFYSWNSLDWFVETGEVFYIFHKDKKHFIMIAKESFRDWDQVALLHQMCGNMGIKKVPAKRMYYVPDWAFVLLLVLFALVCGAVFAVSIFLSVRRSDGPRQSSNEEGGRGAGYDPDRVPLDQQIQVLGKLGIDVPEETASSLRGFMEEYDMYEQVEQNPYTWLLTDLGAPEYDGAGNIVGYSEEVFWFDFEGFDISTDYIKVLEGMAVLAEGSSLDDVSDIHENTDDMDWEQGTGTIIVSLTFRGQEYLYDMEVYNDWIDGNVLGIFNPFLEQENSQKFFYVTGDNGQGAIVFYCTPAWAEEFMKETGLVLEYCTTLSDTELP